MHSHISAPAIRDTVLFSFGLYTPEAVIFAMLAFRLGAHLCLSRGGAGAEIVEEVARRGVTWAYLPPGAWALVLEAADRQPLVKEQCASVRVVYYGARMVHPKILRGVMDLMPQAELIRGVSSARALRRPLNDWLGGRFPPKSSASNFKIVPSFSALLCVGVPQNFQGLSEYTPHTPPFGTLSGRK